MPVLSTALSYALLAYISRLPETKLEIIPGDRFLFHIILARIHVSDAQGRDISASKLAADAALLGLSARTATRLVAQMVKCGVLREERSGKTRFLKPTDKMHGILQKNAAMLNDELRKAGFIGRGTK